MQSDNDQDKANRPQDGPDLRELPQIGHNPQETQMTAFCPVCRTPHAAIKSLNGIQLIGCPQLEDDAVRFL